jgi:hypothetical protein
MEGPPWQGAQTGLKLALNTRNRNVYGALSLSGGLTLQQLKNEEREKSSNENEKQAVKNLLMQGDSTLDV